MPRHQSTITWTDDPSGPRDVAQPDEFKPTGPGRPSAQTSMSVLPGVRRALVDWMIHHRPADHVDVALPTVLSQCRADGVDAPTTEVWSIDEVVRALRDDPTPAPTRVTVLLCLPAGTSFARIASLLSRARCAQPDGGWSEVVLNLACRPRRQPHSPHHPTQQAADP